MKYATEKEIELGCAVGSSGVSSKASSPSGLFSEPGDLLHFSADRELTIYEYGISDLDKSKQKDPSIGLMTTGTHWTSTNQFVVSIQAFNTPTKDFYKEWNTDSKKTAQAILELRAIYYPQILQIMLSDYQRKHIVGQLFPVFDQGDRTDYYLVVTDDDVGGPEWLVLERGYGSGNYYTIVLRTKSGENAIEYIKKNYPYETEFNTESSDD